MDRIYKGVKISKDDFGKFVVHGFAWGDGVGENTHTFRTLKQAQGFIDRMTARAAKKLNHYMGM